MKQKLIKFAVGVIVLAGAIFFGVTIPEKFVATALCDYAGFCADQPVK